MLINEDGHCFLCFVLGGWDGRWRQGVMGRFTRQGCGSEVFARERSGAGGCVSGVAFPTLESSILQSTNGFPWQAILLPVGQGCLAMSGDTFACHGLGKEKGGALGSCVCVCVGVIPAA